MRSGTVYRYADEVQEAEEALGPEGLLLDVDLPTSSEDADATFEEEMTDALQEHASDDVMTREPIDLVTYGEKEAVIREAGKDIPVELLAGQHHEAEATESPSYEPDPDSDSSSEMHVDTDFDPESILPVDMGNPEVSLIRTLSALHTRLH